jgi:teichuronic acid biosynthesis glycosyltransferase TuaG
MNILPVSVIIPCYRCSKTVERAINSVLNQTQHPKEIILVDDGSDDKLKTLNALLELKNLHKTIDIKIISLDRNQGPASARNAAWDIASEPYIAFLDADDAWHSQKLSIQYALMSNQPDIILSGHKSRTVDENFSNQEITANDFVKVNLFKLLLFNYFPTRSVMLKRDIKYRFLPDKRYAEDYLLWLSIALDGHPVYYLDLQLSYSYKNDFGDSGLTFDLFKTHRGEIDAYRQLLNQHKISTLVFFIVVFFAQIKLLRRYIIVFFRKIIITLKRFFGYLET